MPFHGVYTFPLEDELDVPVHDDDMFSFYRLLLTHAANTRGY